MLFKAGRVLLVFFGKKRMVCVGIAVCKRVKIAHEKALSLGQLAYGVFVEYDRRAAAVK